MVDRLDNKQSLDTQMQDLHQRFLRRVPNDINEMVTFAKALETKQPQNNSEIDQREHSKNGEKSKSTGEINAELLELILHGLHKLIGASGTFGLMALAEQARRIEHFVNGWRDKNQLIFSSLIRQDLVEMLSKLHLRLKDTIPIYQETTKSQSNQDESRELLVWVIEDDPVQANEIKVQLESFGLQSQIFADLRTAENAIATSAPDILLIDVMLSDGKRNATQDLQCFTNLDKNNIPIIFMSAGDDFQSRIRASQLCAQGYFLKPLDVPALINRIESIAKKGNSFQPKVLIVEDDKDLARRYQLVLSHHGMKVQILDQSDMIIEVLAQWNPDLILMDLYMPDYSGIDLAGVIRQHDRWLSIPIIYLSAETEFDEQMAAMAKGGDDFLTKPIADEQLLAAVTNRASRAREITNQIECDSLTGLLKHSRIKQALETEVSRSKRKNWPISVAMLDIDHFKLVNDTYGHTVGDLVITSVATLLRQRMRSYDSLGRYGGEEFMVVIPDCSRDDAMSLLKNVCEHFAKIYFWHEGQSFNVTLSAGLVCSGDYPDCSASELLIKADQALYQAKNLGRNRVEASLPNSTPDKNADDNN